MKATLSFALSAILMAAMTDRLTPESNLRLTVGALAVLSLVATVCCLVAWGMNLKNGLAKLEKKFWGD